MLRSVARQGGASGLNMGGVADAGAIVDAEEHQANVAAAHALVTIRRRTGRPIPPHIQALADEASARPVTRRRRWWSR